MPNYEDLPTNAEGRRIARRLGELRKALQAQIEHTRRDSNLLIASWNIRELGKKQRNLDAIYYIAEIISRFDLVAIQEVRGDLEDFDRLLKILGPWWKYLVTDVTEGRRGNDERLAFLYNSRKVEFGGLSGQVVLPPAKGSPQPFARTPFQVGFKAGWFQFQICTTHAYYGKDKPDDETRKAEVKNLAQFLLRRSRDDKGSRSWAKHFFVLGDFNIFTNKDKTKKELAKAGFEFPEKLMKLTSGYAKKERHYDQFAYLTPLKMYRNRLKNAAMNAFDFFAHVYKADDEHLYKGFKGSYTQWRTFQMSDHKPLWIEFATDAADAYLWARAEGLPLPGKGRAAPRTGSRKSSRTKAAPVAVAARSAGGKKKR